MNIVDGILITFGILAIFQGFSKGLISQLINLAAFVFALTVAVSTGPSAGQKIDRVIALPAAYLSLIGFLAVFIVLDAALRIVLRIVGHAIPGILTASPVNRILGIVPSLAGFTLIATFALTAITAVPSWISAHEAIAGSRLAPVFQTFGGATEAVVNRVLGDRLREIPVPAIK